MTKREKLKSRIQSLSTETLLDFARCLAVAVTAEEVLIASEIDLELEQRLSEADFTALMVEIDGLMDAAAEAEAA